MPERGLPPTNEGNSVLPNDEPYKVPTPSTPGGSPPPVKDDGAKKSCLFGMSCIGCGALGCLGLIILMVVSAFGIFNWAMDNFFSDKPLDIPVVTLTDKENKELMAKTEQFRQKLDNKEEGISSIVFTPREINYLFQKESKGEDVMAYLDILKDEKLSAKMSIPLEMKKNQKKIFMNISFKGKIEIEDYDLKVQFDRLKFGKLDITGKKQLESASDSFKRELLSNEKYRTLPVKLKEFKIEDGKFFITVKKKDKTSSESTTEDSEDDIDTKKDNSEKETNDSSDSESNKESD